jgi:hypothetical protein
MPFLLDVRRYKLSIASHGFESCREHRDSVVRQRRLIKGTGMTIVEDLTSLNVKTLNRVRNSDLVATSWTWNGRIFALLKSGKKVIVKPFQPLQDCDAVTV